MPDVVPFLTYEDGIAALEAATGVERGGQFNPVPKGLDCYIPARQSKLF